jgi:hypothetical protein
MGKQGSFLVFVFLADLYCMPLQVMQEDSEKEIWLRIQE